jgi:ribose 5-phosphate isomerase B
MLRIAIGTDHAGYRLKEVLKAHLQGKGHEVEDFGTHSEESVDYPDFIRPAAASVAAGINDLGIVLGGSGNGEAMVANKVRGIRCAVCWTEESARLAREHNNANVISLGARLVSEVDATAIVDEWLRAEFQGGRHIRRLEKMHEWECR